MIYQWKPQTSVAVDAQIAGEELERIRVAHNGRLTQDDVVEAARPKEAPLHDAFEWNDRKAAHEFRLQQAGYLIRMIVVAEPDESDRAPVRAFVNVERDDDRSYTSTEHALSDADLRAQVLRRAMGELQAWKRRYEDLTELARLFAAVDRERKKFAA